MKAKVLLRIAAGCVAFFIVGHTIGHVTRKDVKDQEGLSVLKAMEGYKFPIGSQLRTYDEFYTGMSLNLIISLVAIAILLWIASESAEANPALTAKFLIPVLAALVGFTVTGALYFFMVPALTCLVASVLVIWAILKLKQAHV